MGFVIQQLWTQHRAMESPTTMSSLPANDRASLINKVETLCGHVDVSERRACVKQHLTEEEIISLTTGLRMPALAGGGLGGGRNEGGLGYGYPDKDQIRKSKCVIS